MTRALNLSSYASFPTSFLLSKLGKWSLFNDVVILHPVAFLQAARLLGHHAVPLWASLRLQTHQRLVRRHCDCPWGQQKRQPVEKLHTRLGHPPPPPQPSDKSKTRTTTTTRTTRTSSATTTTTQEKGSFQTKSLDEIGCCTGAQEPADWGYVQLCLQHGAHPDRIHVSACLGHAETSNMQGMGRWALVALLSENLFISLGVKWRTNCMLVERPTVPTLQARHHPKLATCGVLQQQVQAWCLECRDRRFRSTRKESHCHCGSHRDCNSGVDLAFRHYTDRCGEPMSLMASEAAGKVSLSGPLSPDSWMLQQQEGILVRRWGKNPTRLPTIQDIAQASEDCVIVINTEACVHVYACWRSRWSGSRAGAGTFRFHTSQHCGRATAYLEASQHLGGFTRAESLQTQWSRICLRQQSNILWWSKDVWCIFLSIRPRPWNFRSGSPSNSVPSDPVVLIIIIVVVLLVMLALLYRRQSPPCMKLPTDFKLHMKNNGPAMSAISFWWTKQDAPWRIDFEQLEKMCYDLCHVTVNKEKKACRIFVFCGFVGVAP